MFWVEKIFQQYSAKVIIMGNEAGISFKRCEAYLKILDR